MNKSGLYDAKILESKVLDIMGNEIIRGHVVACSKAGRGQRDMIVGVVTSIIDRKGSGYNYSIAMISSNYDTTHMVNVGVNDSVVILNDLIYSLNSKKIIKLFEVVDSIKGRAAGELIQLQIYNHSYNYEIGWNATLPKDYIYGEPIDDEQVIFIPNPKAISKLRRDLKKKRV